MQFLRSLLVFALITINLSFFIPFLLGLAFLRFILPFNSFFLTLMDHIYWSAVKIDKTIFEKILPVKFDIIDPQNILHKNGLFSHALILSNHQSWADILILQNLFYKVIPPLKFIVKWELIFFPIVGFICWAYEFPFVKRYSKEQITKKNSLQGKDKASVKKACLKALSHPTSIVNFVEGRRFQRAIETGYSTPYKYLMPPKVGGLEVILSSLNKQISSILNITLVYPEQKHVFYKLISGQINKVTIIVEQLSENDLLKTESGGISKQKLEDLWSNKDHKIKEVLRSS